MSVRLPTNQERLVLWEMMLRSQALSGGLDEVWRHPATWRALGTMRRAVRSLDGLARLGRAVAASRVKRGMEGLPFLEGEEDPPFMLDEVVEHLLCDGRAKDYWMRLMPDERFPHQCPLCGLAAFVGFTQVECRHGCFGGVV